MIGIITVGEPPFTRRATKQNKRLLGSELGSHFPRDKQTGVCQLDVVAVAKDIRIVDGGIPAYKAAGFPLTQEYFGNSPGKLPAKGEAGIGLTVGDVLKVKGRPGVVLVDARPHNEYVGNDDVWLRKGHISGAISFHWARLMEKDNTHKFKSFDRVKAELAAAGLTPDKDILVYCGTSREGSLLRFYLRHVAKYPRVRLYEGSWKEYAALKQHPAETKENKAL